MIGQPGRERVHQTARMAGHEDAVVTLIAGHLGAVAGPILTLAEPDAGIRGRNRLAAGHAVAGREHTVCRGRTRRPCRPGDGGRAVITGARLTDDRRVIMHAGATGHECDQHGRQQQFPLWPGACPQAGRPVSCPFVHRCIWSVSWGNDNIAAPLCQGHTNDLTRNQDPIAEKQQKAFVSNFILMICCIPSIS